MNQELDMSTGTTGLKRLFLLILKNCFELVALSVFFTVSCLPLLTIPSALVALTSSTLCLCRDEGHPLRLYWKTFLHPKGRWYRIALPQLLLEVLMAASLLLALEYAPQQRLLWIVSGINAVGLCVCVMVGIYLYPLILDEPEAAPGVVWKHAFAAVVLRLPYTVVTLSAIVLLWGICLRTFTENWIWLILAVPALSSLVASFSADFRLRK